MALTLMVQVAGSWTAPAARAADPGASPDVTPAPLDSPVPTDAGSPIPTLSSDPTADPGITPAPTVAPDPSPSTSPLPSPDLLPSPDAGPAIPTPGPSASAEASPSVAPTPTPIPWQLSSGQQLGTDTGSPIPLYKLQPVANTPDTDAVHTLVGITSPECAACHAAHTGQSAYLIDAPAPSSTLCFRCHSGSGSPYDVAAQFDPAPTNDPNTDSYYQHLVQTGSTRLVTCDDCHNPHDANSTRPAMSTSGWTASGDIRAANGVAVTNGAAATEPTFTPISRSSGGQSLTFEYQLCFACHSGATTLRTPISSHPSWWALDKGIELNPANTSYHPIEAAGRNQSTQMAASLAGTSPFKAWNYTTDSTIRCASCHGDPSTVNQTSTSPAKTPSPDIQEATHASANRGLLIAPYRDRLLKAAGDPYNANDFALCLLCHAEAPFKDPNVQPNPSLDPTARQTAFDRHGFHLANMPSTPGLGTSIDQPGDGPGLALCAECHFRPHSTALAYQPGDTEPVRRPDGSSGLIDFAPDVQGLGSNPPVWTPPNSLGVGSCALTCHGFTHPAGSTYPNGGTYLTAPGTSFTATPTSGSAGATGLVVQFTDATRYATTSTASWSWDFGDGGTSIAQSPAHTYTTAGTYAVSLTVTRTSGPGNGIAATMTRTGYVTVAP